MSRAAWALPLLLLAPSARAHDLPAQPAEAGDPAAVDPADAVDAAHAGDEVTVEGERPANEAASRVHVARRELELRPRRRVGDVLEAVPGLFAVQHAGGGKANQWFLRGFDADHGTDIAFFVDGVPLNAVSHGHGQGYTDVNFLIPELVSSLEGYKGPYYAAFGDFATAGAVNLALAESLPESRVEFAYGNQGSRRALVVASPSFGEDWRALLAGEIAHTDGPFAQPEDLGRYNLFARASHDLSAAASLSLTVMAYGSDWNGSGQIPARAVCGEGEAENPPPETYGEPCIDRFDSVDRSEGGATTRQQVSLRYAAASPSGKLSGLVYAVRYRFSLFSNFTFYADDPALGDEIEQGDERTTLGADVRYSFHEHLGPVLLRTTFGLQSRADFIDNSLWHTADRERLEPRVDASIAESELGLFGELDARVTPALRFVLGLRADRIDVNVEDELEDTQTLGTKSSGATSDELLSPKLMAVVTPLPALDLFAAYGRGFHSNDARGAVLKEGAATLITPALAYEVGARLVPLAGLRFQASAFLLDLDSEIVWSGDAGGTEPSGATRRYGLEIGARYQLGNVLFADADATFVNARYRENAGNGNAVALAPTRTFTAGVGARPSFGPFTPFGAVRVRSIADRPAVEDESFVAEGFTTFDLNLGARYGNVEAALDVQNVFDAAYREVNFANESRLAYEPAAVTGIHYTPGWPRTLTARGTLYFD
jgi:outer membrane receptor protein involved in Fe transport